MKGKFRKFLSVLLTASMVSSLFAGTTMAQGSGHLFKDSTTRPRLIVSEDGNEDMYTRYQSKEITVTEAAKNAILASSSDAEPGGPQPVASPSDALGVYQLGDGNVYLNLSSDYTRAAMSEATVSNATQRVSVILEAGGKTYQDKVDLVANWFNAPIGNTVQPQEDTVTLERYSGEGAERLGLASGKDCTYKVYQMEDPNSGESDTEINPVIIKEKNEVTLNFANRDRSKESTYRVEMYDKAGKLLGCCYVDVEAKPMMINGEVCYSVADYIEAKASEIDTIDTLTISDGSMSYADWSSIKSLKNLQTLEVTADVSAAQTSGWVPRSALEGMTSLKTVSLNTASKEKAAELRSANEETGITTIYSSAFSGCTSLTTVDIPGVQTVYDHAFENCEDLKSVNGPDLNMVETRAFSGCKALQTADFPELGDIGKYAFADCTSLKTLTLPKVKTIRDGSFQNCINLEHITLPEIPPTLYFPDRINPFDGVTILPLSYTLVDKNMNPLKDVDLQESLWKYSMSPTWRDILGLPDPNVEGKISFYLDMNGKSQGQVSGDSMTACLDKVLANNPGSSLSDIERIDGVSGTVTTEDWKTIEKLTGLTVLNIGDRTTSTKMEGAIPEGLKMPKGLVSFDLYSTDDVEIPASMFEGCAELRGVAMNRVTTIGPRAFAGCTALGSGDLWLPDVPPVLGYDVFAGITMHKGVLRTMSGPLQAYENAGGQWQGWFGETPAPQPQPQPKPQSGSSSSSSTSQSGKWVLNDRGWWYDYGNGLWPSNQWSYLYYNGRSDWYYFDAEGYLATGWYTDAEGRTYYLHPLADGRRGYMYTGWNQIDGVWYYFSTEAGALNGMLLKNTVTPDGYRVDENGAWVQ